MQLSFADSRLQPENEANECEFCEFCGMNKALALAGRNEHNTGGEHSVALGAAADAVSGRLPLIPVAQPEIVAALAARRHSAVNVEPIDDLLVAFAYFHFSSNRQVNSLQYSYSNVHYRAFNSCAAYKRSQRRAGRMMRGPGSPVLVQAREPAALYSSHMGHRCPLVLSAARTVPDQQLRRAAKPPRQLDQLERRIRE